MTDRIMPVQASSARGFRHIGTFATEAGNPSVQET